MDSHASQLKGGGYEVFLMMEFCSGGGLIDFMNTRLQHRLTEPEILKIFGDVAEGVACMHYLKPPLLHRDLKVENVLISKSASGGTPTYKLCDFGSTAPPRPAAKTAEEGRLIEEDVQKHTTMQYRSPEMIDVWRKQPIDEKADIWALGVLLYKLCYYTTPFEDVGQMAILNASYKYPSYPAFTDRLKKLIAWTLKEDPRHRPNIYQVIKEVCSIRGVEVPIKDIYADRTQSEARRNESLPTVERPLSSPSIGLQRTAPPGQIQSIPEIAPMRRGRPTAPSQQIPMSAAKPSPSPARGDPFAALDSKNYDVRVGAVDELSKRFPSLDEFSITVDKGGQFSFPPSASKSTAEADPQNPNQRATQALADEAFAQSKPKADVPKSKSTTQLQQPTVSPTKSKMPIKPRQGTSQQSPMMHQPTPVAPGIPYISTGVGSSPPPPKTKLPDISKRPIWRVPDHSRSTSQPRASEEAQAMASSLKPSLPPSQRPALLDIKRTKSQTATFAALQSPASSRPSLESRRPSQRELAETPLDRAKSAQQRQRPSSVYVSSNLDYLRDQEASRKRPSMELRRHSRQQSEDRANAVEETNIDDDMDYLRNTEGADVSRRQSRRKSAGQKRSSLPSLSGAKNMFAGRFGDAFKRFEQNGVEGDQEPSEGRYGTQPPHEREEEPRSLSPIPGSEATPSKHLDTNVAIDETEDLPPDVRRELERRRLGQEEKRVAEAAAEYRARVAAQGTGGAAPPTRANTIQKRVQSLLDEGRQSRPPERNAEGYGKYTKQAQPTPQPSAPLKTAGPPIARKPVTPSDASGNSYLKTRQQEPPAANVLTPSVSAPPTQPAPPQQSRVVSRPSVPPKSQALRTGGGGGRSTQWSPRQSSTVANNTEKSPPPPEASKPAAGGLAALLAKDLEGVPDYTTPAPDRGAIRPTTTNGRWKAEEEEDMEADFSKRYPSLSGIEMVETEIASGEHGGRPMRVKEV